MKPLDGPGIPEWWPVPVGPTVMVAVPLVNGATTGAVVIAGIGKTVTVLWMVTTGALLSALASTEDVSSETSLMDSPEEASEADTSETLVAAAFAV